MSGYFADSIIRDGNKAGRALYATNFINLPFSRIGKQRYAIYWKTAGGYRSQTSIARCC